MRDDNLNHRSMTTPAKRADTHGEACGGNRDYDFSGPHSLAEHFSFPDAVRTLQRYHSTGAFDALVKDGDRYGLRFSGSDVEVKEQAKRLAANLRQFADWLDTKVEAYDKLSPFGPELDCLTVKVDDVKVCEPVAISCGCFSLYAYVHQYKNVLHVSREEYWDTIVSPDPDTSPEHMAAFVGAFTDLYTYAASGGQRLPD